MTRKQRRLTIIGGALAVLAVAAALVLNALRDSIVFFSTPSMVAEKHIGPGQRFRLGGMVEQGSLTRGADLAVTFEVTDGGAKLPVAYKGILPDLLREGQGVVAEGSIDPAGVFKADTVLAKHDISTDTLSTSHVLDLSHESFAALRLPAIIAAISLLIMPMSSFILRLRKRHFTATLVLAAGMTFFLIASHIALGRFGPYLSSEVLARQI